MTITQENLEWALRGYGLAIEDAQKTARPNSNIVAGLMNKYATAILELETLNKGGNTL